MHSILKWITGLMCAVIQLKGTAINDCSCSTTTDEAQANCDCFDTVSFPSVLDEKITLIRNLTMRINSSSNSNIIKFKTNHFSGFNLTKLEIITGGLKNLDIPYELLQPLTQLEMLNISSLGVKPPRIPTSVMVLIANCLANASHPNMTHLDNLEVLSFSSNFLENFPIVSKTALLYDVNLIGNSLRNLTYDEIAPYCYMRELLLKGSLIELDPEKCCGLKMWFKETNITSDLHCGKEDANCDARVEEHNKEATNLYENCLNRTDSMASATLVEFLFQIIFSSALIIALGFLVYKYYGSQAVKKFRESKNVTKPPKQQQSDGYEESYDDQ